MLPTPATPSSPQDKEEANLQLRFRREHGQETEAAQDLRQRVVGWLRKQRAAAPLPKFKRLSSWTWIYQLDNMLCMATTHPLADIPPSPAGDGGERKGQEK